MRVLIALLLFANLAAVPLARASEPFRSDREIRESAEHYSQRMVLLAEKSYGIKLDWSDSSVASLEKAAAKIAEELRAGRRPPSELEELYKLLGSYVGEVFRKNHGAEWGWVTLNGKTFEGMKREKIGVFWPWGKARGRLVNGAEDNLWSYYQIGLLSPIGAGPQPINPLDPDWEEKSKIFLRPEERESK